MCSYFQSVRDFGGGVVFEALAVGAVPVVVDFGRPGDTVYPLVGYKVPLTNENDMVAQKRRYSRIWRSDRDKLNRVTTARHVVRSRSLTWDAKAQSTTRVLTWAVGQGLKPDLVPPKLLHMETAR